jgi:hypothetical protein
MPTFTLLGLALGVVCQADGIAATTGGLLHHRFTLTGQSSRPNRQYASLLHFPSGRPARPLAGTMLCGVRTFLDLPEQAATTRSA